MNSPINRCHDCMLTAVHDRTFENFEGLRPRPYKAGLKEVVIVKTPAAPRHANAAAASLNAVLSPPPSLPTIGLLLKQLTIFDKT